MISYMVAKDREAAAQFAAEQGWERIALDRFAAPDKEDIRYAEHAGHVVTGGHRGFRLYVVPGFEDRDELTKSRIAMLVEDGTVVPVERNNA